MVDEQVPAKKVVKRVVKKTVVRPHPAEPTKTIRYGRPARPAAKAKTASSRPKASASTPARVTVARKLGAAGKGLSSRGNSATSAVGRATGAAARATSRFTTDRFHALRSWRIPHLNPFLASAITGTVVGLVAVGLGLGANAAFAELRGVATGGGRWGSLTFVVVTFVAFVLGELLLSAFGCAQARLTSFLGVVLTIVGILGLFLEASHTVWAFAIVPLLGAVTYLLAHWLMEVAENTSTLPE